MKTGSPLWQRGGRGDFIKVLTPLGYYSKKDLEEKQDAGLISSH
jgi:hypothetical protein